MKRLLLTLFVLSNLLAKDVLAIEQHKISDNDGNDKLAHNKVSDQVIDHPFTVVCPPASTPQLAEAVTDASRYKCIGLHHDYINNLTWCDSYEVNVPHFSINCTGTPNAECAQHQDPTQEYWVGGGAPLDQQITWKNLYMDLNNLEGDNKYPILQSPIIGKDDATAEDPFVHFHCHYNIRNNSTSNPEVTDYVTLVNLRDVSGVQLSQATCSNPPDPNNPSKPDLTTYNCDTYIIVPGNKTSKSAIKRTLSHALKAGEN